MKISLRGLLPYLGIAVFSVAYYAFWTRLSLENLPIVNYESGDLIAILAIAKEIITGQWPLFSIMQTTQLGAPFGMLAGDYPLFDWLHYLIIAFFGLFTKQPALVINLFWISSFALISVTALFSFHRLMRLNLGLSWILAVIYAFMPFHWERFAHIFLANYFLVPLLAAIALRLFRDEISPRFLNFAFIVSFFTGMNGVYYAYFYLIFLTLVLFASLTRSVRSAKPAMICMAITIGSLALSSAPYILYRFQNGKNPYVSERLSYEADIYALRLSNIVLPGRSHLIPLWEKLRSKQHQTLEVEGKTEYLTFFAIAGLVLCLFALLDLEGKNQRLRHLRAPAIFLFFGIIFASPHGLASLISNFITPQFRAPNRISVYLAFYALLAFGLYCQSRTRFTSPGKLKIFWSLLFGVSLIDISMPHVREMHQTQPRWNAHQSFFQTMDRILPKESMVFQIPYMGYPETPAIHQMGDYSPMIPYLHSNTLRWSFGVIKYGPADRSIRWIWSIFEKDVVTFLSLVEAYGYKGILVDHLGFSDLGARADQELGSQMSGPRVSVDSRFAFFDFSPKSSSEVQKEKTAPLKKLEIAFTQGFYDQERTLEEHGRLPISWIGGAKNGKIEIFNPNRSPQTVPIYFHVTSQFGGKLEWNSAQIKQVPPVLILPEGGLYLPLKANLAIPPGYSTLNFSFSGELHQARHDWRRIGFKLFLPQSPQNNEGQSLEQIANVTANFSF